MNPQDNDDKELESKQNAADLVRQKIENIYNYEPNAEAEEREVEESGNLSKHQKFMRELMESGRSTEYIQNAWHQYYLRLDDKEKKEVWDEFYSTNKAPTAVERHKAPERQLAQVKNQVVAPRKFDTKKHNRPTSRRHVAKKVEQKLKEQVITPKPKLKAKHYFQSLAFGLSMGFIVLFVFLFSFFNEIIIAPLIQPSRTIQATPVIIGTGDLTAGNVDEVIIPKINVEIPVDYNVNTTNENVIENDLEGGAIHYPDTPDPGQIGNAAFFGHSSNNIFNPGKYKFAFVLLHTLTKGDTFYLTFNHTVYIYKVISTYIVNPSAVYVLDSVPGQTATATLITCDPPGTSINRLIVVGEQISPSVSNDTVPDITVNASKETKSLPNNGPSLWSRFTRSASSKTIAAILGIAIIAMVFRKTNKRIGY